MKVEIGSFLATIHRVSAPEATTWCAWYRNYLLSTNDRIGLYLLKAFPIQVLQLFTDMTPPQIDACTPSQLEGLARLCIDLNPQVGGLVADVLGNPTETLH
ncbi:hypothetical protein [Thioalbus denitrificans]|uniref:Uncharacterized protein n=1 Tax=Thioalbus denitrificans TaxID=547122 RepID=A0A369CDC6_9GAMM|nr:hypothetical protein [Thioalbus denitrificans]RCX31703.1 hypothetical protein DFQ59_10250 [Thioalbus denitrificans]